MRTRTVAAVLAAALAGAGAHAQEPVPSPAPTRIARGAVVYIEPTEFGMALSAAILKKHVPVVGTTDRSRAAFFVQTTSEQHKEGGAERVAKILVFGGFGGSGRSFNATVTIVNAEGSIVFAHNSKKGNFQSAAENIAKEILKHVIGGRS